MKRYQREGAKPRQLQLVESSTGQWEVQPVLGGEAIMVSSVGCPQEIASRAIALASSGSNRLLRLLRAPTMPPRYLGKGKYGSVWADGHTAYKHFDNGTLEAAGLASLAASVALREGLKQLPDDERAWNGRTVEGVRVHAAIFPTNLSADTVAPVWAMDQLTKNEPYDALFKEDPFTACLYHRKLLLTAIKLGNISSAMDFDPDRDLLTDLHYYNYIVDGSRLHRIDLAAMPDRDTYVNKQLLGIETYPHP